MNKFWLNFFITWINFLLIKQHRMIKFDQIDYNSIAHNLLINYLNLVKEPISKNIFKKSYISQENISGVGLISLIFLVNTTKKITCWNPTKTGWHLAFLYFLQPVAFLVTSRSYFFWIHSEFFGFWSHYWSRLLVTIFLVKM